MKKTVTIPLVLLTLLVSTKTTYAQQPMNPVERGSWTAALGVGVGNIYGYSTNSSGLGLKLALERGTWDAGPGVITIGGEVGYSHYSQKAAQETWKFNNVNVGARSAWHFGWDVRGLDTYAGIPIGLSIGKQSTDVFVYEPYNSTDVSFYLGFFVGASYFFSQNFGVNVEMGYTTTLIQFGVMYKF